MELEELKSNYKELSKKYQLPSFEELNENFEIDRIDRDTDTLAREIRKVLMEKVISYIKFIEMILNPSTAPPMFLIFLKQITQDEKHTIEETYKPLVDLELKALKVEIEYSEKSEAEQISEINKTWNKIKPNLLKIIQIMEKNWNSSTNKKDKSYFG